MCGKRLIQVAFFPFRQNGGRDVTKLFAEHTAPLAPLIAVRHQGSGFRVEASGNKASGIRRAVPSEAGTRNSEPGTRNPELGTLSANPDAASGNGLKSKHQPATGTNFSCPDEIYTCF